MHTILHTEWSKGWGGQEIRIIQESLEFLKKGYRMMIACQPESEIYKVASDKGIAVIPLHMRSGVDPLATMECVRLIKKNSIDLVQTHSSIDSWCCSMGAKLTGVPVIRSRHLSTPINKNYFSFFLYMKLADRVITSGETIRQRMIAVNGYDPKKIVSIPAGVDEHKFYPEVDGNYVRKDLNIKRDDFLLGIVAVLRRWKGHFYLLEAVKALEEKIPNIKLLIAGTGPQEEHIKEYIKNNGLAEKVIMTGYRKDVPQILKSLDLFILPSYANEATTQVIPQAMAIGVPVLSTFAGGIEEVVTNGKTGTLVPPKDVYALKEMIHWAYRNKEEIHQMAQRAHEFILQDFTLAKMIKKTEKIYKDLLERHSCGKRYH